MFMESYTRRSYLAAGSLNGHSVEEWCERQMEWIRKRKQSCETPKDDVLSENSNCLDEILEYKQNLMFAALSRVPIAFQDERVLNICAIHVDRIAIAVMISYLLWYDATKRNTMEVTAEDADKLLGFISTEEDWHRAWEDQKFIPESGGALANMLDVEEYAQSLKLKSMFKV
jgi:hypothetical protein